MTHYFLDSSALVKRYVPEPGTGWVRSITQPNAGNTIIVAHITQVEVVSGVMRRKRDGQLSGRMARAMRMLVNRHASREYLVVGLTGSIVQRATDLLEIHPLRAYDSVQLSSALEAEMRLMATRADPVVFVSADTRLLTAADAAGLATIDPSSHP